MNRGELTAAIQRLRQGDGPDEDQMLLLDEVIEATGYPDVARLICHTHLTDEQAADAALAHKPIAL